jgi:hypothetical protein
MIIYESEIEQSALELLAEEKVIPFCMVLNGLDLKKDVNIVGVYCNTPHTQRN